jgi:hypothetical protein
MIREMNGGTGEGGGGGGRSVVILYVISRIALNHRPCRCLAKTRSIVHPLAIRGERQTDIAFPLVPRARATGTRAPRHGAPSWSARTRSMRRYVSRLMRSITYKQFPLMGKDRILPLLYESD